MNSIIEKYKFFIVQILVLASLFVNAQNFERISNKEGFNQNTINAIQQDKFGYLWFGTPNGLIKYDGYEFISYTTQSKSDGHILSNYIHSLYNDQNGVLWIGTNLGLNVYIPWLEKFYTVPIPSKILINKMEMRPDGRLWVSAANQLFTCELLDVENGKFKVSKNLLETQNINAQIGDFNFEDDATIILGTSSGLKKINFSYDSLKSNPKIKSIIDFEFFKNKYIGAIFKSKGIFWIVTDDGIFKFTIDGDRLHILDEFNISSNETFSNKNFYLNTILEDNSGTIWIGLKSKGLYKYNKQKDEFEHFQYDAKNQSSISSNYINVLYQDEFKVLWIGTAQGGINKLDLSQKPFITYTNNPFDKYSISDNLLTSIFEDKEGRLWLSGYNSQLFRSISPVTDTNVTKLKFEDLHDNVPLEKGDIVRCIYEDKKGFIWFGTDLSLMVYNPTKKLFKKVVLNYNQKVMDVNVIRNIIQMDDNNLLLAGHQIIVLENPWEEILDSRKPSVKIKYYENLRINRVQSLIFDDVNSIWLGTTNGLFHVSFDGDKILTNKKYTANNSSSLRLSYSNVFSLFKEGNHIWIGTFGGGLNKMTLNDNSQPISIDYFRKNDILPDDAIYGILPDDSNNLWLSTDMGLVKFNKTDSHVNVYDVRDGLPQNNFRQGASFHGKSGYFYFGGLNGLTIFKPNEIDQNSQPPEVLISALSINNKRVSIGEKIDGDIILKKSISETDGIAISQNERIISFSLAVKHTSAPSKNQLSYKLEGFNEDWILVKEGKTIVTYTNLSAGDYIFKVKAANRDGVWSTSEKALNLEILPPWYNTWWSYTLFTLLALGIGIGVVIYFVQHERLKQGLKYEKMDKERLETINQGKFQYFTNLSHEFRTPLTLIAGPLERIIETNKDPINTKYLSIVQKNTKRLLSLADQLITFRQAEEGRVKLNLVKSTLGDFIYPTTEAFENYAIEKNINFFYKVSDPNHEIIIDIEKFERIIFNLLSNSFKNTPSQGTIRIEANIESGDKNWIKIDVIDNGKGIPKENLDNIFERFYQLGNKEGDISGGGIGLSFCKSLVNLFEGEIYANSTPGIETRFTVRIPQNKTDILEISSNNVSEKSYIKDWVPLTNSKVEQDERFLAAKDQKEFFVLVVENEEDVQNFLYNELSKKYNVSLANNGVEALEKIKAKEPNLIISDVMMPEMDGYQLCEIIKSTPETCHLPVLLLTALGGNDDIIKGLEFGADEYLSKPFSIKHLDLRVSRLIQNSIKIREYFTKNSKLPKNDKKIELSKKDESFIENISEVIEKHLSDSNFGVEELSVELGLSTSHFYRRLKQLTGQVPNVYLRNFRLQRAAELLNSNEGFNVAEVMYQIGIESNSYFSTSFKKLHGVSPSEYLKKTPN